MVKRRPSTRFVTAHVFAQRWPRRTDLPSVFTAFVRGLEGAATPDADLFHDAWHGLRAALATELKRRGLWRSPPSFLGVCGWERWDAEPPAPTSGLAGREQGGALGELVADAYAYIFVDRLPSLKRQLEEKPDITGLVLLNVRHFLHERQRAHDPLGFRVFELLQGVVASAVADGDLRVESGDGRIRNDSVLAFAAAAEARPAPPDFAAITERWNDDLLPALLAAPGRQQAAAVDRLRRSLLALPRKGVAAFRFRDLLDPLKSDARRRWASFFDGKEWELAQSFEARQSFEALTRRVSSSIGSLQADPRTRFQLAALWSLLRRQEDDGDERSQPSQRQLARHLSIPRQRLPGLFAALRELVARCRAAGGSDSSRRQA